MTGNARVYRIGKRCIEKSKFHYCNGTCLSRHKAEQNEVKCSIEVNLLGQGDLAFDLDKEAKIVGLEFGNFSEILKKFNCDCDKQTRSFQKI